MKYTVVIIFIALLSSCTWQNEEDYFGVSLCDTALVNKDTIQVTYDDLIYIFDGTCLSCHNSGYTEWQGIQFDTYDDVVSSIETGKVIPAIRHESVQMPKDQDKLSDCEIQLIEIWINRGMPQ